MICRQEWQPCRFKPFSFKGKLHQIISGLSICCFRHVQPRDILHISADVSGYSLNRGSSSAVPLSRSTVFLLWLMKVLILRCFSDDTSVKEGLKVQSSGSAKHLMLKEIKRKTRRLNLICECRKMFHTFMRISEMVIVFRYFLGLWPLNFSQRL